MTHQLLFLRHAKSSWDHPDLSDHERPLDDRGIKSANAISKYMASNKIQPDLAIVSTAQRTRQTVAAIALNQPGMETVFDDRLYGASFTELIYLIAETGDDIDSLLVVSHNPTMGQAAMLIANEESDEDAIDILADNYPTGALAVFETEVPWAEIGPRSARLASFVPPRSLLL